MTSLQWRHNERDSVSNHQPRDCLLNRLFRRRSKKTSKLRVTSFCTGIHGWPVNSPHKGPVTRKRFPFDDVIIIILCRVAASDWSWLVVYDIFLQTSAIVIFWHGLTNSELLIQPNKNKTEWGYFKRIMQNNKRGVYSLPAMLRSCQDEDVDRRSWVFVMMSDFHAFGNVPRARLNVEWHLTYVGSFSCFVDWRLRYKASNTIVCFRYC